MVRNSNSPPKKTHKMLHRANFARLTPKHTQRSVYGIVIQLHTYTDYIIPHENNPSM